MSSEVKDPFAALESLKISVLRVKRERDSYHAALSEILEIAEDREDINNSGGPNDWMKVAQIIRAAATQK